MNSSEKYIPPKKVQTNIFSKTLHPSSSSIAAAALAFKSTKLMSGPILMYHHSISSNIQNERWEFWTLISYTYNNLCQFLPPLMCIVVVLYNYYIPLFLTDD